MNPKSAFTLIELLIVVAIIAILAAIAVPNFLEAQTRSKVSRVLADFRSLATAIESYAVDQRAYPTQRTYTYSNVLVDFPEGLIRLSTPVAYMTNPLLRDPFKTGGDRSSNNVLNRLQYIYQQTIPTDVPASAYSTWGSNFRNPASFPLVNGLNVREGYPATFSWFLVSYGPDKALQLDDDPQLTSTNRQFLVHLPYDPTNGTVSDGDIFRWGP